MSDQLPHHDTLLLPMAYLPPLDWFIAALRHQTLLIDLVSPYRKQSYRNRCYVMTANGLLSLTIPVHYKGLGQNVKEVTIDYSKHWQRVHWRAIVSAYNRSPFFLYYRDSIEKYYTSSGVDRLVTWNQMLLQEIFHLLGLERAIYEWDNLQDFADGSYLDFSQAFHPKTGHRYAKAMQYGYRQVFAEKFDFQSKVCILDLLFNLGPESADYLMKVNRL